MHEIRCPSCRMRLWLYQGMGREVSPPEHCPACCGPVDHADVVAPRLAARIASDHRAERAARERADDVLAPPPVGRRTSR